MKTLGVIFLWLIALFIGGCGAFFTISGFFEGPDPYLGIVLVISIPSLVVGILAGHWAYRLIGEGDQQPEDKRENLYGIGSRIKSYNGREILRAASGVSVDGEQFSNVIEAEKWIDENSET